MATVNLGRIKPVFRGAYSGSTAYVVDDIVTHGNESFICIQAHGAGTQATSQTAYWTKLAAKGTDGTDVGTTITTQGDILYRDGSGLQRLPKGTAAQQLAMNAGATAPEWVNASSDYVKIANGSVAGNASSLSIDGYYSSTYKNYRMYFQNIENGDAATKLRFNFGGSANSSSAYRGVLDGLQNNQGNVSGAEVNAGWNSGDLNITNWGATNGFGDIVVVDIFEPQSTNRYKRIQWVVSSYGTNEIHTLTGQGYFHGNQSTAATGLTWIASNPFTTGDWYLYGIKG